ncbi:hypothetical protein N9045_01795 [bacterium]|nr:hypothetical protein [bacterium]
MNDSCDQAVFELCFDDHDSFYRLDWSKLAELAELPLGEMCDFVVDNGESTSVSSDSEVDFAIVAETDLVDEQEEQELRKELREAS